MANPMLVLGGIAVGVITAAIGVLAVPGWIANAQDAAAVNDLASAAIMQEAAVSAEGHLFRGIEMASVGGRIGANMTTSDNTLVCVNRSDTGDAWAAVARSASGTFFARTSDHLNAEKGTTGWAALQAAGGLPDGVDSPIAWNECAPAATLSGPVDRLLVEDSFDRNATGGWGTADTGQAWVSRDALGYLSADGDDAHIRAPLGATYTGWSDIPSVSTKDVRAQVVWSVDGTPDSTYIGVGGRVVGSNYYAARVRLAADGGVKLFALKNDSSIKQVNYEATMKVVPSEKYVVAVHVSGTSPTTVKAKVWKYGEEEPDWQVVATDNTAGYQAPGHLTVYGRVPNHGTADLTYHDFIAVERVAD